jgi:translation initiation factor IF-2
MSDIQGDGFSEVLPDDEPNPRAVIGDNLPPVLPTVEQVQLAMGSRYAKLFKRAQDLIDAEARMPLDDRKQLLIETDADEKKFSDTVRLIQGAHKELETARVSEKQPYDSLADAVHGMFREAMDLLVDPNASRTRPGNAMKHRLEAALTRYKKKKDDEARAIAQAEADRRRAEEETARRAAEAAAAEAERLAAEAARKRKPELKAAAEQAAQAAAQQAAEQAAQATAAAEDRSKAEEIAAAPAADLTRSRGSFSVASLQEFLDFRDIDRTKVPAITLWPYLPADAIEKAVRAYMAANSDPIKAKIANQQQPITGVTFFINHRTNVR